MTVKLRALSLGAGVQSTTLALMAAHGEIGPMPDCAIFSDTGDEGAEVYAHLDWLMSPNVLPFPIHRVDAGRPLSDDIASGADHSDKRRFATAPFFTRTVTEVRAAAGTVIGEKVERGIGCRQCTKEFKLEPIAKMHRELLGLKPRQRSQIGAVEVWIGISKDEAWRAKPSRHRWQTNRHPLLEARMDRRDCLEWLRRHDYPEPPKSACIFCPYRRNEGWRAMRDNRPEDWAEAIRIDKLLRSNGMMRGIRAEQFVHDSLVPLEQADLTKPDDGLFAWIGECEGMCGV